MQASLAVADRRFHNFWRTLNCTTASWRQPADRNRGEIVYGNGNSHRKHHKKSRRHSAVLVVRHIFSCGITLLPALLQGAEAGGSRLLQLFWPAPQAEH